MSKKRKIPEINKKNFPYPLVRIYWEDIIGETTWSDIVDIKKSMVKQYGKKKGEAVFYAMENSGKLKSVKKKSSRNK